MSHLSTFYFRAKLDFSLLDSIRRMLRNQFKTAEQAELMHQQLLRSEFGASAASAASGPTCFGAFVGDPYPGPYYYNDDWIGHAAHPFFDLPRASYLPKSGDGESRPSYVEYPDGSSIVEFSCEINNGHHEIHEFLEWIKPYVRQRYGKRNRGREKVWVGWWSNESMSGRVDVFIKPCPTSEHPAMRFGREVEHDYRNRGSL